MSGGPTAGERLHPHFLFETSKRKRPCTVKRKDVSARQSCREVRAARGMTAARSSLCRVELLLFPRHRPLVRRGSTNICAESSDRTGDKILGRPAVPSPTTRERRSEQEDNAPLTKSPKASFGVHPVFLPKENGVHSRRRSRPLPAEQLHNLFPYLLRRGKKYSKCPKSDSPRCPFVVKYPHNNKK